MEDAPPAQRSRGMRDVLAAEMQRLRAVEGAFLEACRAWGYREVRTPVIEPLHLFTAAGTLSPQTLDRVYSFLDWDGWSGERVVLRPDSTIAAARLYAEQHRAGEVARLCYSQDVFRFTDDDSDRQEWQCGVELIGDTGPAGDVELVVLALDVLRRAGVVQTQVRLSHAGVVRGVLAATGMAPDDQVAAYDRLLDGDTGVVDEMEARLPELNAPLRMLFDVEGAGAAYLENVRAGLAAAIPALAAPLDELTFAVRALEALGVRPVLQAALARSFEYYSGLVVKIDGPGGRRLSVGGRYDGLVEVLGGQRVPASGFALYLQSVAALLRDDGVPAEPQRIAPSDATPEALARAHAEAAKLRTSGAPSAVRVDREP